MDNELAAQLAGAGIKTRDDLADLAVDELVEITNMDEERAKTLIVKARAHRSEEYTSELQSLMRISYAVFCLKKKKQIQNNTKVKKQIETRQSMIKIKKK